MSVQNLLQKAMDGRKLTADEVRWLAVEAPRDSLYDASHTLTVAKASHNFHMCSIVNAKSGRCPENCKWCAQSAHYHTHVDTYDVLSKEECFEVAKSNEDQGVHRFALVASGRKPNRKQFAKILDNVAYIKAHSHIGLCASLGLLNEDELKQLREAGVTRYHCNLEAAPSFFPQLCSTHTQREKIETLQAARRVGLELCSGGIIGMGETMEQRIEFAFALAELGIESIPVNLLCPIPGTPLQDRPPLTDEEVLTTISIYRFVNPTAYLRFAGGRLRISQETAQKALYVGINSAIVGDMLTTLSAKINDDKQMIKQAGYQLVYE